MAETIGHPVMRAAPPATLDELLAHVGLVDAVSDSTRAQLLALGLLVDKEQPMQDEQRTLLVQALGAAAAQEVDDCMASRNACRPARACRCSTCWCRPCDGCRSPPANDCCCSVTA